MIIISSRNIYCACVCGGRSSIKNDDDDDDNDDNNDDDENRWVHQDSIILRNRAVLGHQPVR